MKNCNCEEKLKEIEKLASKIRINTLKSLTHLGFGHYGGSLSVVEVLAVLYGGVMNINPEDPNWKGRDYFVLSKGHAGPALYATLALKGFFPVEEIYTLNQNGTNLPSHPDRLKTKGVDATTGSLGQGISIATGIATALKMDKKSNRVFSIIGDGEINEGQCWEAFQFIAHHNLNNLTVFLDYNKQQLDGTLEEIIKPFSFENKLKAFGFDTVTIKGDDIKGIYEMVKKPRKENEKPLFVILDTVKGQGVEYIEKMKNSHHLRLTEELKKEIEEVIEKLEREAE
ncbi:transketolase [Pseudoleptotrichia goodfellowii]|uniref:Transketolase, thiamine diphosphate binding domain protein n=1 Tax=Pseudoleptotrichia goodfellowii F0264 TaxID=596323 RepID=D0GPU2_9FUSO|nr:transketolase [Pseudoleptotrichia goodfellowii]EEY33869.1 Transketolase, thiamine diphosphate binding domain protein [Pseudoleptotrichia goodfellowii F0264]MBF4805515.1 transketolase [Pseudoleptotrichia goodfellowii]